MMVDTTATDLEPLAGSKGACQAAGRVRGLLLLGSLNGVPSRR